MVSGLLMRISPPQRYFLRKLIMVCFDSCTGLLGFLRGTCGDTMDAATITPPIVIGVRSDWVDRTSQTVGSCAMISTGLHIERMPIVRIFTLFPRLPKCPSMLWNLGPWRISNPNRARQKLFLPSEASSLTSLTTQLGSSVSPQPSMNNITDF